MVTRIKETIDSERLSALVDGEIDEAELTGACEAWRLDEATRATWHSYHLIGDVLRSDDLSSDAAYDCAFLIAVRTRLASEPVVLAPHAMADRAAATSGAESLLDESLTSVAELRHSARASRPTWMVTAAMAAGLVLVVGTFTVMRSDAPSSDTGAIAVAAVDRAPATRVAASFDRPAAVASENGPLLRDARLDRYLEAHQQFAGSSMLGGPSAFLRSATVDSSAR